MRASLGYPALFQPAAADSTRLALAAIDIGLIEVVTLRAIDHQIVLAARAAQIDRMLKDLTDRLMDAAKLRLTQTAGKPGRMDLGQKEGLIGIDIAHTGQDRLIEQGGLDTASGMAHRPL